MSYAWELADRAKSQLKALETWLQEETLDAIDELAASPIGSKSPQPSDELVHDFFRERGGTRFYVFITFSIDAAQQTLRILTIGSYSRHA